MSRSERIATAAFAAAVLVMLGPGRARAQGFPDPGMTVDQESTAVVVTDPEGLLRGTVGVTSGALEEGADGSPGLENLERLLRVAKLTGFEAYRLEHEDQIPELRKLGFEKVVLAGTSADPRTESHLRRLLAQGFEVAVVKDAMTPAKGPDGDRHEAALASLSRMANAVWSTDVALKRLAGT